MLSLAPTDMTDGQPQPSERHSKGFFKDKRKRFKKLFSGSSKDIAVVAWSFTEMLLKRLPDAVDTNPAKMALGIVKIVLQIKDVRCCSSHRCLTD